MKIVMHCVYFPPEVGGLESHIYYLCRELAARGHQVEVVTSRSRPDLPAREVVDGISVWRTWMPARNTPGWAAHAMGSVPRVSGLIAGADVLHAQDIAAVLPLALARGGRRIPLVTTYHTSHFLMRAESPIWRPIFRRFLRLGDHNFASSQEIADVGEAIAPGVRVEALTNGVETDVFRRVAPTLDPPPAGRARLVVPRRLFEKNGVEYLVRALPDIVREVDAEAVVIGDGPERAKLEALATELGVLERVHFLGARPHSEMPGLLSGADVAIFPSLMEATSVAALEAMACEVPVAASRVGGLPEIVDGEVGTLFEAANPEALARAVVDLLGRPDRDRLARAARKRVVDLWSNKRLAERHLEVYGALSERYLAA